MKPAKEMDSATHGQKDMRFYDRKLPKHDNEIHATRCTKQRMEKKECCYGALLVTPDATINENSHIRSRLARDIETVDKILYLIL